MLVAKEKKPRVSRKRVVVVGCGRVGSAFVHHLKKLGYSVIGVFEREDIGRLSQADDLRGDAEETLARFQSADVVFLTVPDREIRRVFRTIRRYLKDGALLVHCSGAFGIDIFKESEKQGLELLALHPLKSFLSTKQAIEELPGGYFGIDGTEEGLRFGKRLVRQLHGRPIRVTGEKRPIYHVMCVFAANFLCGLFDAVERLGQVVGLSSRKTRELVFPLTTGVIKNIMRYGGAGALTGPVARGDETTIRRHIRALRDRIPELLPIYRELTRYLKLMKEMQKNERKEQQ